MGIASLAVVAHIAKFDIGGSKGIYVTSGKEFFEHGRL
jgi:hypothetical protein